MSEKTWIQHSGTPQNFDFDPNGSGRYRQGSGENPHQHGFNFLYEVSKLRKEGLNNTQIAKAMGYSTTEWRAKLSVEKDKLLMDQHSKALKLRDKGWSNVAIGKELGISEGKVRGLLKYSENYDHTVLSNTVDILKKSVDKKTYIDVGEGVERDLGISRTKMDAALQQLKDEGYTVRPIQIPQINSPTGQKTTMLCLAPPGTTGAELYSHMGDIKLITEYHSNDQGLTFGNIKYPVSLDSSRIFINYADSDGNQPKDGVIELRPGVGDISLGQSKYAQVRIMVDDRAYMKGMAMYADDIPDGYDIRLNTNKKEGASFEQVFKPCKTEDGKDAFESPNSPIDKDNPFGATIKAGGQPLYSDKAGNQHQTVINKVNEEGDWGGWDKSLASQFLSKQDTSLAAKQLNISYLQKKEEFDEIMSVTNPIVKKELLTSFADDCDTSAVELKAAAMPRQATQVILPLTNIKETDIFAPNFKDGEKVCLVRYPHSGPTEIAELRVNNKSSEGINLIGKNAKDCVGIHPKVAEKLSGADFDGDSVIVIPQKGKTINVKDQLEGMKGFDPKRAYPGYPGMKPMTEYQKGLEMGKTANLITDMMLIGCSDEELTRAIKHSMVVIDAYKHKLNWKQSEKDNRIDDLKKKYQAHDYDDRYGGAGTLISRAKSPVHVNQKRLYSKIDPVTGEKITEETGKHWVKKKTLKDGTVKEEVVYNKTKSTKMAEAKDAWDLVSDKNAPHAMEVIYANYANQMKRMGNQARLESLNCKADPKKRSAAIAYSKEVADLEKKLNRSLSNAPHERQAQALANTVLKAKKEANPYMTDSEKKKIGQNALNSARAQLIPGGKRYSIEITPKEWEAIQANAISGDMLKKIIKYSDLDTLKSYATPKNQRGIPSSKIASAKAMLSSGYYTQADVAEKLGVSVTTLMRYVNSES